MPFSMFFLQILHLARDDGEYSRMGFSALGGGIDIIIETLRDLNKLSDEKMIMNNYTM